MSKENFLFTSESVSEGHPDKVSDRVSDAVVDLFLAADPLSRVAVETLCTTNRMVLAGEVRGPETVTYEKMEKVARHAVRDIGYEQDGFHWNNMDVEVYVHAQSTDIAQGVDASGNKDEGAGIKELCLAMQHLKRQSLCRLPFNILMLYSDAYQKYVKMALNRFFGPMQNHKFHCVILAENRLE